MQGDSDPQESNTAIRAVGQSDILARGDLAVTDWEVFCLCEQDGMGRFCAMTDPSDEFVFDDPFEHGWDIG